MTSPLLTPMTFANGRVAPNRVWLAPMTNQQSHGDGRLSEEELRWLKARSDGGFGVIESCATHVSLDGQGWEGELGIYSDKMVPGWRRLAEAVHEGGGLLIAQTFHGGARALRGEGRTPWSCSPSGAGEAAVVEGPEAAIERVIRAFGEAARRVEEAGGDGVELHGAHGYLLCQFLSPVLNRRGDAWGGSLENRARFIRGAMQASRGAVSAEFIVGVRLSPEDYGSTAMGLDIDESLQVAQWLCEDGADFVHISLWDGAKDSAKYPGVHPATMFREGLPGEVPVITAGGIWSREEGERQLELGADAVALGRSAIANPEWPRRVAAAGEAPARPPLTAGELRERGLSEAFVEYMRRWKGFVAE